MKIKILEEDDIVYLTLSDAPIARSTIVNDDFNYDFDIDNSVVGVEVINARFWLGDLNALTAEKVVSRLLSPSIGQPFAKAA